MVTTTVLLTNVLVLCFTTVRVASQQVVCPSIAKKKDNTNVEYDKISGLTMSPTQLAPSGKPVIFGVGDAGSAGEIYLYDSGDEHAQSFIKLRVKDVAVDDSDWESLTIGSCGATGVNKTCLYISDAGDNKARESNGEKSWRDSKYRLIKIEEPLWEDYTNGDKIQANTISTLDFTYKSSSSPTNRADCEAIFLDNAGWGKGGAIGDLYLVTKWNKPNSKKWNRLFQFPAKAWVTEQDKLYSPEAVGSYDGGGGSFMGMTWTGAEMSFDGTLIILVGFTESARDATNYLFLRCPGSTIAETLVNGNTKHCLKWDVPVEGKNEALAWSPDGTQTFNVPEGYDEGVGVTMFDYDPDKAMQTCPQVAWVEGSSGMKCRTISDGNRKPNAWCEAADGSNGDQDSEPEEEEVVVDVEVKDPENVEEETTAIEEETTTSTTEEETTTSTTTAPEVTTTTTTTPEADVEEEETLEESDQEAATDADFDTPEPPLDWLHWIQEDGGGEEEDTPNDALQVELSEVATSSAVQSTASWIVPVLILATSLVNIVCQV